MRDNLMEVVRSFRAMNTDVEAVVCLSGENQDEGERVLSSVEGIFSKIENTLSCFKTDSELSRLNKMSGRPFPASQLLFQIVKESLKTAHNTGGIFDPTILPMLCTAGYDRSFEALNIRYESANKWRPGKNVDWRNIRLESEHSTIELPLGCSLDLGGIGKGWAVDLACCELQDFSGYAVDAGGDIRVGGRRTNGLPWTIGVADPYLPERDLLLIKLDEGAICTSSTIRRSWYVGDNLRHHLIDPRTGEPSQSGVVATTIIAESAVRAETVAKSALIMGAEAGIRFIENQTGLQGLMVRENGSLLKTSRFPEAQFVA